jgi:hypothetical protein
MNNYKAPRDKLICILNCCKVIFGKFGFIAKHTYAIRVLTSNIYLGLMKHMEGDEGADVFLPLLIYVVIRANPPRLISNVQYVIPLLIIYAYANCHLKSEAGYYLTNLVSCGYL